MRFVSISGISPTWTEPPTTTPQPRPISTTPSGGDGNGGSSGEVLSTTPANNSTKPTKESQPLDPIPIAIAVAAVILVLLLAAVIISICLLCKKRKRTPPKPIAKDAVLHQNGHHHHNGSIPDAEYGNVNSAYEPEPEDTTGNAHLMYRPDANMENPRDAEVLFRSETSAANTRDAEVFFTPSTSATDTTRTAQLVSSQPPERPPKPPIPTPDANPLDTKVGAQENFYSDLPDKRTDGAGPSGSGLTRNRDGTYVDMNQGRRLAGLVREDSSDSEDEITREKRRIHEMQMQEPEYY